jgi:hypothetical protein
MIRPTRCQVGAMQVGEDAPQIAIHTDYSLTRSS